MEVIPDSDRTPAMLASNAFDNIIDKIRTSNLNFQIQMSPFSAYISLKRTLIKEKSGAFCPPPTPESPSSESVIAALVNKNLLLESKLVEVHADYARAVDDCLKVSVKLEENQKTNIKKEPDDANQITSLGNNLKSVIVENNKYREVVREQEEEIKHLQNAVKIKEEIANNLNKQMREFKLKTEKENIVVSKRHKDEVKSWRKDLGEERKEKIKLEKKLEKF